LIERAAPASRYAIITDSHVEPLYGERAHSVIASGSDVELFSFPAGEWNKSRESWSSVTDQLLRCRFDRDAVLIAVGGGVTGDLAGFVAATFLRGIRYVQVPTTLLAMVDSSVGGNTGVDTEFGKNLVGAFHQPSAVLADVNTLRTLPPVHVAAGMAEALKHGIIADAEYFQRVLDQEEAIRERDPTALAGVVQRSVEIKSAVVAEDERDHATLNFGHTVAHGLEALLGYELLHGEAVAIGMLTEARLGERVGATEHGTASMIRAALEAFRLPLEPPTEVGLDRLIEVMRSDKKVRDRTVRFALPACVGCMARSDAGASTIGVDEDELRALLAPTW
jgi:3-dehydroquinate synthase